MPTQTSAKPIGAEPTLDVRMDVELKARRDRVFHALIHDFAAWFNVGGGADMRMTLEPHVGGRMWRDLGDAGGHLWGTVQVIKPPTLLEIAGPLFVSLPSLSHLTFRLHDVNETTTKLEFRHLAIGMFPEGEMYDQVHTGWHNTLAKEFKAHVERHH